MKSTRLPLLAAIGAATLLVAACTGDDAGTPPTEEPTATSAATAEPASEPSATAVAAPVPTATAAASPSTTASPAAEAPATTDASGTAETSVSVAGPIGDPRPAPELAGLIRPDGSAFDLADLRGAPVLVYFGYTHCPDVCPATLGELFGVFEALPETQALFVSVDPERDTPEFLEEWTRYLPDNLTAVTGSPGAIRRAADNYGVKYARVETTSTAGYTMSHTAELYLIDHDGQLLLAYPFGTPAAEIVEDLRVLESS